MPSGQILYLMMFVGNLACTSHVLQYSSSLSYEHSRSLQSFLCSGAVTVLICSFFVAALLNLHNFEKRRQNYTLFYNLPNFSAFFCIFRRIGIDFYYSFIILCTFAPEASRAVPERVTRQPSFGNHGGQYDAEATFINFKTFQIMQQHIYYIRYALRFADMQISELVSVFNDQVQNRGWSSMRAYHDQALIDEFQRRGIDTTAVTGRKTISFVHPVRYDQFTNRLIPIS